jgi:hypothetical protein
LLRLVVVLFLLTVPAVAQVTEVPLGDEGLMDQLTPDSLKLEADAIATHDMSSWETAISYQITNNSGMNLVMGIASGSVAIGACTDVNRTRGGLSLLPNAAQAGSDWTSQVTELDAGPIHAVTVLAGGKVSGTVIAISCRAPNPGFPTATLSMTLMLAKSQKSRAMFDFPMSIETPVRQVK